MIGTRPDEPETHRLQRAQWCLPVAAARAAKWGQTGRKGSLDYHNSNRSTESDLRQLIPIHTDRSSVSEVKVQQRKGGRGAVRPCPPPWSPRWSHQSAGQWLLQNCAELRLGVRTADLSSTTSTHVHFRHASKQMTPTGAETRTETSQRSALLWVSELDQVAFRMPKGVCWGSLDSLGIQFGTQLALKRPFP